MRVGRISLPEIMNADGSLRRHHWTQAEEEEERLPSDPFNLRVPKAQKS